MADNSQDVAQVRTIAFDIGGVVVSSFGKDFLPYASGKLGIEQGELRRLMDRHESDMMVGEISELEFWKRVLRDKGMPADVEGLDRIWIEPYERNVTIDEDMMSFVRELKKDYIVGCISDTIGSHVAYNRARGVYEPFSPCILSNEVGLRKPGPEIFRLYLKRAGCGPQECVVVDDNPDNFPHAKSMGIHTVHYKDIGQLRRELAKFRRGS